MTDFSDRLQILMLCSGVEKKHLHKHLGMGRAQVSKWLNRKIDQPRSETIKKIAESFKCDQAWLISGEGTIFPSETNAATKVLSALLDYFQNTKTLEGFAELFGLDRETVYRWVQQGRITTPSIITHHYGELNPEWVKTGEGEMFTTYQPPAGNTINFAMGKKSTDLPPKLEQMMTWISEQDDGRDYWAWMEMEFSEKFEGYKKWIKEQQQEKKESTGTDN